MEIKSTVKLFAFSVNVYNYKVYYYTINYL